MKVIQKMIAVGLAAMTTFSSMAMSDIMKSLVSAIVYIAVFCAMCLSVSADEIEFDSTRVYPVMAMNRFPSVHMNDGENAIEISCSSISNVHEEYFISVYEKGTIESAHYIVKYLGPVNLENFRISGLISGKDYSVLLSSTSNIQNVSGKIRTLSVEK